MLNGWGKEDGHASTVFANFILVAGDFKALFALLVSNDRDVRELNLIGRLIDVSKGMNRVEKKRYRLD